MLQRRCLACRSNCPRYLSTAAAAVQPHL
jgi:hypothetical protein